LHHFKVCYYYSNLKSWKRVGIPFALIDGLVLICHGRVRPPAGVPLFRILLDCVYKERMLLVIPPELLPYFLQQFLTWKEYKLVMDSSKTLTELKFRTVYLKLNANVSRKIYEGNAEVQNRMFALVYNPKNQISLNLSYFSDIREGPAALDERVHAINFSKCSSLADVSALVGLQEVNLSGCQALTSVASLAKLHTINLTNCQTITDVSMLGNAYSLNLTGCSGIVSVEALGNVHTLNLSGCRKIVDFHCLKNVYNLNLSYCDQVTDVVGLDNVHILDLSHCKNIRDISPLKNVYCLSVSGCKQLKDFSCVPMSHIRILNISHCTQIEDLSCFKNVQRLFMMGCYQIRDVSILKRTKVIR
jgi:Leucine-rich repeat (LRR) protein